MSDLSDIDNDLQDVFDSSSSNNDIDIEEDLGSEGTDEDTADKESADKEDKDSTVDPNSEVVVVEENRYQTSDRTCGNSNRSLSGTNNRKNYCTKQRRNRGRQERKKEATVRKKKGASQALGLLP